MITVHDNTGSVGLWANWAKKSSHHAIQANVSNLDPWKQTRILLTGACTNSLKTNHVDKLAAICYLVKTKMTGKEYEKEQEQISNSSHD